MKGIFKESTLQQVPYNLTDENAIDALALQGARASAAMILTQFSWTIPSSAPEGLILMA